MQPVAEKVVSYMRTEMRSTAEATGRSGKLAEAMVDADIEIKGLSEKGKLLTLDTAQALSWGVASFEASTLEELVSKLGYSKEAGRTYKVETVSWNWAERFSGWISNSAVSGILMSMGTVALMVGIYTGGSVVLLGIGALLLGFFFFGHLVVDLVGLEELILIGVGAVLIGIEIVVPGFGIPGIAGGLAIIAALGLSFVNLDTVPLEVQWAEGLLGRAINTVLASVIVAGIAGYLVLQRLPEASFGKGLSLSKAVTGKATDGVASELDELLGKQGTAATELRPSGTVSVDGKRYDAMSESGFIASSARIRVSGRRGFSLLVESIEETKS